jgi:hypothetical protein
MGLDIYLSKCPDLALAKAAEKAAEDESDELWSEYGKYEDLTEEQKEGILAKDKEIRAKHGLIDYTHASVAEVRMDSPMAPDHLFKIGYLRSYEVGLGICRARRRRLFLLEQLTATTSTADARWSPS